MTAQPLISDVSDTALWVAVYRAQETERPDALFKDPLASRLAGDRGREIAARMSGTQYTGWTVVTRTCIIDSYLRELIAEGVDAVINLGAGLDTRPYRMDLPARLRWIEADYSHMVRLKNENLADQTPRCHLERVAVDLANDHARREFLSRIGTEVKNAVVLTEGVLPYLTPAQAGALAEDLRAVPNIKHWILDYMSPHVERYMNTPRRKKEMKNAPFQFFPKDWFGFFDQRGWTKRAIRYYFDESEKLGRPFPMAWWMGFLRPLLRFLPKKDKEQFRTFGGYAILVPKA